MSHSSICYLAQLHYSIISHHHHISIHLNFSLPARSPHLLVWLFCADECLWFVCHVASHLAVCFVCVRLFCCVDLEFIIVSQATFWCDNCHISTRCFSKEWLAGTTSRRLRNEYCYAWVFLVEPLMLWTDSNNIVTNKQRFNKNTYNCVRYRLVPYITHTDSIHGH